MRTAERWFRDNQLVITGQCTGRVCGFVAMESEDPIQDQVLIAPILPNTTRIAARVFQCQPLGLAPTGADGEGT
jgi:hypothetical protein